MVYFYTGYVFSLLNVTDIVWILLEFKKHGIIDFHQFIFHNVSNSSTNFVTLLHESNCNSLFLGPRYTHLQNLAEIGVIGFVQSAFSQTNHTKNLHGRGNAYLVIFLNTICEIISNKSNTYSCLWSVIHNYKYYYIININLLTININ